MPCDNEAHASCAHNMVGWPQLEKGERQEIYGCENICLFCLQTFQGTRTRLLRHLSTCTGFQSHAAKRNFRISDSLYERVPNRPKATVVEHYGKSISSDDPRHLHYKANLLNNPLLRKKPNLPFVITVKRRFGIPVDSPSGESVPSTNSHIMPDMPDSSSILAQSVIAETQAGSKAHQSLRQNSSKRVGNRSTKQPLLPPLFESVRKSARTRASSALLAASVYQAQHGTPSEPSEGRRDTDGSSAENSTALANVGVGPVLTPATSVTPDSVAFAVPPLPERADSSKSSAYVTEDDTGVPATQRSSLVSTDTETADQPFDTRDVSGPFASAAEAHNAGSSKTFRPLQPHSVDTLIHRPDGDHQVDSHRTDADRERCDPVTYREQTPGPFQRRADDESSSEVSSDEHIRARSPDVGIQVGGPVVDLMGNTEDSEGCEREQAASCTPSTEHAFTTEVDIISKSLAEDPSKQLADAPSSPLLRNTFLAVNSQPSKPLSTTSRLSGDSTSTNVIPDIIHSKLTACTTRTPAKQEHTFLPLTSIADELRPVPNFDAKLSASLGSDGMLASEWVRGLEDTLFTRLKLRFDESFASGQLQVHSGTGTVRKRKSADAPEDGSNQPDKSISEFSQMPEKRIRLVDPAEDDGEHANGREAEARDKLIESLRAENDSYRSQIAELYKMIGNIAGTVSAPIVITESVHSAELAKDPAVRHIDPPLSNVKANLTHGSKVLEPWLPLATSPSAASVDPNSPPVVITACRSVPNIAQATPSRHVAVATPSSKPVTTTTSTEGVYPDSPPVGLGTRLQPLTGSTPNTPSRRLPFSTITPRALEKQNMPFSSPTPLSRTHRTTNLLASTKAPESRTGVPATSNLRSLGTLGTANENSIRLAVSLLGPSTPSTPPRTSAAIDRRAAALLLTPGFSVRTPISIPSDDQEQPIEHEDLVELYSIPTSSNDDSILKYLGMSEEDLIDETESDGINCGFKALATAILGSERCFHTLRLRAYEEFCKHEKFYMSLGWFKSDRSVEDLKRDILGESPEPRRNWFRNPIHTRIVANAFKGFIAVLEHPDAKTLHIYGPSTRDKTEFFAELLSTEEPNNRFWGICLVRTNHWKLFPPGRISKVEVREKLVQLHRDNGLNRNLKVTMNWDGHMFVGSS